MIKRRKCARGRKKWKARKSGAYRIPPQGGKNERADTCKILHFDVTIRKNFQFHAASKPQFSPSVPERGIVDPEKLRRLGFVPPRHEKGFPE